MEASILASGINKAYEKLAGNTLIFAISQFSSKFLLFFMLPLYTHRLTTAEYGIIDLTSSTISLALPILTMQIGAAALRFLLDTNADSREIFKFSFFIVFSGSLAMTLAYPFIRHYRVFDGYEFAFLCIYILSALDTLLGSIARGLNEIRFVGVMGILKTVITVALNIIFLLGLQIGLKGYFMANILSLICSNGMYLHRTCRHIFRTNRTAPNGNVKVLRKSMVRYSIPLIPNSLNWWIISSLNRFLIRAFCGISILGLYSAASRIPSILVTVQTILNEAFVLSVVEEYGKKDSEKYFSELYELYNAVIVISAGCVISFSKFLASLLLANDFASGWIYIPFLTLGSVFGGLLGYVGTFYSASKENKGIIISTLFGAVTVLLNSLLLIPLIGAIGAAIGNVLGNGVILLYRCIDTRKYVRFSLRWQRHICSYALLLAQILCLLKFEYAAVGIMLQVGFVVLLLAIYRLDIILFSKRIVQSVLHRFMKMRR